jgi:uncharacterized protein (TIGR02680 family)
VVDGRWDIKRTGFINFWYYGSQEFFWKNGRPLPCRINGSGKRVITRMFLPLLTDEDSGLAWLSTFRDRDGRLDIRGEGGKREERIGYLYMEFVKNDELVTVGLGTRARKRRNHDVWYFCAENRAVGRNLCLVKKARELDGLTRAELCAELGADGLVFDSQREYIKEVNRRLFGFPSIENYKELLELIDKLCGPALSKDFKPSVMLEILSDSLPSLTDADLRPLTEAVENIDNQQNRLTAITESFNAVGRILEAYRYYNRLMMTGKLRAYIASVREFDRAAEEYEKLMANKVETENDITLNNETIERLCGDNIECEQTISALSERHEAEAEAMERLTRLRFESENYADSLRKKNKDTLVKRTRISQSDIAIKTLEAEARWRMSRIDGALKVLEGLADEAAFEEHELMTESFAECEEFDFLLIKEGLKRHDEALREGVDLLENLARLYAEGDELNKKLDESGKVLKDKNEEFSKAESDFFDIKSNLTQAIDEWAVGNTRLTVLPDMMEGIHNAIKAFKYTDERLHLTPFTDELLSALRGAIDQRIGAKKLQMSWLQEEKNNRQAEIRRLREAKEIEPERLPETVRAREYLQEHGIPFAPFYKLSRFKPDVSETSANRVEEALWRMGILDAIVIPEKYRETVLKAAEDNPGLADKYMFVFDKLPKLDKDYDLAGILEVDGETGLKILADNALKAVYYGVESHTAVNASGSFRIGAITGTASGEYISKFIGAAARERSRQAAIHALQVEIEGLVKRIVLYETEIKELKSETAELMGEYKRMPGTDALTEAAGFMRGLDVGIQIAKSEYESLNSRIVPIKKEIDRLNAKAAALGDQIGLPADIKAYKAALENMRQYSFDLADFIDEHNSLLANVTKTADEIDRLEALKIDLDNLLYDTVELERRQNGVNAEINSVEERLCASGYEEVVRTIGARRHRMEEIKNSLDILRKTSGALESKLSRLIADTETAGQVKAAKEREMAFVKHALEDEAALRFTDIQDLNTDDRGSVSKALNRLELGKRNFVGRSAEDMEKEVHNRLSDNLRYLWEYEPKEEELFERNPEMVLKINRLNITCVAEGRKTGIDALYRLLERKIEIQRGLIEESDRKLFEEALGRNMALKISNKIYRCDDWVRKTDQIMKNINIPGGLAFGLAWVSRAVETEEEIDARELAELLKIDAKTRNDEDFEKISARFRSRIRQARKAIEASDGQQSLHFTLGQIFDYRKWFDFRLSYVKTGESRRELTDKVFSQFSDAEKAMSIYAPMFCSIAAKYEAARSDAPRIILLDEVFAGVDDQTILDVFRLMA